MPLFIGETRVRKHGWLNVTFCACQKCLKAHVRNSILMYEEESIFGNSATHTLARGAKHKPGYKNISRVQLRQNVQMDLGTNVIFSVLLMQTCWANSLSFSIKNYEFSLVFRLSEGSECLAMSWEKLDASSAGRPTAKRLKDEKTKYGDYVLVFSCFISL